MGRSFVKNTLSTDKEIKLWEGSYHEIMNEANYTVKPRRLFLLIFVIKL